MRTSFVWLAIGVMSLILTGCTTVSRQEPVPVEDRSIDAVDSEEPVAAGETEDGEQADTVADSSTDTRRFGSDSPVVLAMLDEADEKRLAGDHPAAVSMLERALAREPKNAYLWHRLAALRLEQKDWQQAYVLANKSNSLVRDNPSLKMDNWHIIAAAKKRQGDTQAVEEAEREIRRLREGKE